jgi:ABC-type branched-subunit amino acid transport system ATPase component
VSDVSVTFGGVHALEEVSFTAERGQVVAIIGPNGAGKTSLLNAICGIVPMSRGQVEIEGRRVEGLRPAKLARAGLGRSFQDPRLLDRETTVENLLCGSHLRIGHHVTDQIVRPWRAKSAERVERDRARQVLVSIGLERFAEVAVGHLPYGVRKFVDIARALMSEPRVLVLDEPSSGLDAHEQRTVERMLGAVNERGDITIVIVEHHMDLVRAVADHVVALRAGRVLTTGTAAQVLDSTEFRAAVLGRAV